MANNNKKNQQQNRNKQQQNKNRNQNQNRNQNNKQNNQNNRNNQNQNKNKNNRGNINNRPRIKVPKKTNPLLEPNHPLAGKELQNAARELTKGQIRPTLKQYGSQLEGLQNQENYVNSQEQAMLGRVQGEGAQGSANIKSYYDQLAEKEAAFLNAQQGSAGQLQSFLAGNAAQTQQSLSAAQQAAQGGLWGSSTGQPIQAQQQLAEMGQEYAGQAAQNSQAQNAAAATNQQANTNLATGIAQSGQLQGGEQISSYNKGIANRLGEIGQEYGKSRQEIGEGRRELDNAKKELIEKRPEIYKEALRGLRQESQQTYQANKALGIQENESKAGAASKSEYTKQIKLQYKLGLKKIKAEEKKRIRELNKLGASEKRKAQEQHAFREKEIALTSEANAAARQAKEKFREGELKNPAITGSGKKKSNEPGAWRSQQEANHYLQGLGVSPGELLAGTTNGQVHLTPAQVRHKVLVKMTNNGISAPAAKAAIKKYIGNYEKRLSRDPNGKSLGR